MRPPSRRLFEHRDTDHKFTPFEASFLSNFITFRSYEKITVEFSFVSRLPLKRLMKSIEIVQFRKLAFANEWREIQIPYFPFARPGSTSISRVFQRDPYEGTLISPRLERCTGRHDADARFIYRRIIFAGQESPSDQTSESGSVYLWPAYPSRRLFRV